MKKILVHIPRPNQNFHVGFALISAFSLVIKTKAKVDILVCDDSYADCPVKSLFGKKLYYGTCNECEGGIKYIDALISSFKHNLDIYGRVNIFKSSTYIEGESETSHEKSISILNEFKNSYLKVASSNTKENEYKNYAWISELCTLTSATAYDIASTNIYDENAIKQITLAERTKRTAKKFLHGKEYDTLIVYNGRHTASKAFWSEFKKYNPHSKHFIHEIGLSKDSFSILNGVSNEDHFELLPTEYFPQSTATNIINDWEKSNNKLSRRGLENYIEYMNSRLDGRKNFYGNKIPFAYTRHTAIKDEKSILIMLSSYDEVSIPYPIDRVLYEQNIMPKLIKSLGDLGYRVHVRLHPRSITQYENSIQANGTYKKMVEQIRSLTEQSNIYLYMPRDQTSSYDLMKKCRYVISLFSIAAIEAQSIGCISLVHSRCRGNHAATGRILGFTSKDAIDTAHQWLKEYKYKAVNQEVLRKTRLEARKFLGEDLFKFSYKLPGFAHFSPFENNLWQKTVEEASYNRDYYNNPLIDKLIDKYNEAGFKPITHMRNS